MTHPALPRFIALRESLFFGSVLGLLLVLNGALDLLAGMTAGVVLLSIVGVAVYLYAAQRATYHTGKLGTGMLAGFLTGLVSSVINLVVLATVCLLAAGSLQQRAQAAAGGTAFQVTAAHIVGYDIGLLAVGVLLAMACGLLCGTMGGMIAIRRGSSRQATTSAHGV